MNKKLLKNAYVLISSESEVEKLNILIEDNIITNIFKSNEDIADIEKEVEVFDLKNKLITPGLINTHTHSAMSLFKGIADDASFKDWLEKEMFPREEMLVDEYIYSAVTLSIMEMLKKGITTFVDMWMFLDQTSTAVIDSGMRAYLSRGLAYFDDKGWNKRINEAMDAYGKYNNFENRLYIGLGPHAPYTVDLNHLKITADLANKYNMLVQIHLFENNWEKEKYKLEEFEQTGIFYCNTIAAHCVYIDKKDLHILSRNNVTVSHNPSSNLKLGNGIAPIVDMINENINVSLGTDGSASNNSLDILKEMNIAALLQKSKYSPESIKVIDLLRMIWDNGAFAVKERIGRIEIGYKSDLTVFNLNTPDFYPFELNRLKSHFVYSNSSSNVFATMVDGKWLYYNNEFLTIKEEYIYEQFQKSYKKLEDNYIDNLNNK